MSSLREALETALVENPDDLATHRAYADYLQEHGDPRGEFIQVQLALEETGKSDEERRDLQQREQELLAEHAREWLGELGEELLGSIEEAPDLLEETFKPYDIRFARGWLDRIVRRLNSVTGGDLGGLLCRVPQARLLRELILECAGGIVPHLVSSPFLTNLRVFRLGEQVKDDYRTYGGCVSCEALPDFIAILPRIEELYLLANDYDPGRLFALPNLHRLRILQVYHLGERYPLEIPAGNPHLGQLTHLLLHPHAAEEPMIDLAGVRALAQSPLLPHLTHLQVRCSDLGDVGCTDLATSGLLKRLKVLDLRHGRITDEGARILATCPDLSRLEHLDVERNGLTPDGIEMLYRVVGSGLRAADQQTPLELEQEHYLVEGCTE
jgi:uncharacterized protein (TIGR02996 family)